MRLKIPALFTVCCVLLLVGASGVQGSEAVQTRVLLDNGERIVLDYDLGDYESQTVDVGGEAYQEIWFPSEPVLLETGAPALPHINRSIVIPDQAKMKLRVIASEYQEVFAKIAPSKGNLLRTVDPKDVPYVLGDVYRTNAFYPGPLATLGEPYIMRDLRGIVVQVNPFQYNPVTNVLRIYTDLTVEVTTDGPGSVNTLDRTGQPDRSSRAFHTIFKSHFMNPPSTAYDPIDEDGEMLIICHDPWISNMAPFVAHKASMGITATVVGVSTIGNNANAIKSHIQSVYDSSNLAFVLLVGDIAEIASFYEAGGASDPSYAKLAGGDNYPEIIVGRFSAQNAGHVDTQVQRTIDYETMPATEQDWFWKGIGIASTEGAGQGDEGQSDNQHMAEIRSWLMGAGYTEVDEFYGYSASASQVSAALHDGRGIINYCGHGWMGGFSTTGYDIADVNALQNVGMLPVVNSVACNTGEFESGTCFAEAWLRATHSGEPTGAVGMYASTISQSWAPPMEAEDEFNLLLTDPDEPYFSYGAMCFAGSSSMMDDYGSGGVDMFDTWIIFGDPSLRIRGTAGPTGLVVEPSYAHVAEGQAGGPFAPQFFHYTLKNLDSNPMNYVVTVAEPWLTLTNATGTIPPLGSTVVTASLTQMPRSFDNGTYDATLTFINRSTHEGDTTRPALLSVGIPVLQQQWSLDTSPRWTTEGQWQWGAPTGEGGEQAGNPDPPAPATGVNLYGVNLEGDYEAVVGGPYWLTSEGFQLPTSHGASVRFKRWLNTEGMPRASAILQAKTMGTHWTTIWENTGPIEEDAWSSQSHSVAAVADFGWNVQLRWGYTVHTSDAVPCSGWNIDDVEVWAKPSGTARIELTVEPDSLSWTTVQGAIEYDVVRGDLGTLVASGGDYTQATVACVTFDKAGTSETFTDTPDSGQGFWILVRGNSTEGPMTYQSLYPSQVGVRDDEIEASGVACP